MISQSPVRADIVLVGGGHSHVEVLRRFAMTPEPGVRLTVIARDIDTPYSGMIPGFFAGHYTRAECHIDLRPLAMRAGARLYRTAATGLDPARKLVLCDGRPPVRYGILSLDIGSAPDAELIPGAAEHTIPVKPIDGLLGAVEEIEGTLASTPEPMRIAVIGAGAGGVELTLALHHRLTAIERPAGASAPTFTIAEQAGTILPTHASGARRALKRALKARGIELRLSTEITAIEPGRMVCANAPDIPFDRAILVSGAGAPVWLSASGIATDERDFVVVDETLRSPSHPEVFAAGDVAAFAPRALPKSGVYAVRQGPLLAENLRRAAQGRALRPFRPQRNALALISTGPKHAVASRGPFSLSGRYMWRLKDRIDRRFMEKYSEFAEMRMRQLAPAPDPFAEEMRCAGCAAKTPRPVLSRVMARLAECGAPGFALSPALADDAAVLPSPPPGQVVVETVDQFRGFIDDPWLLGRITANHCLGDLHATGAKPASALAMVMLPDGSPHTQEEDLVALLTGACEVLSEAGASLVGGHTGEGAELVFGLAVTGYGAEEKLLKRSGLSPGDALILTRPLGSGIIFNADMKGEAPGAAVFAALDQMQVSSGPAARILIEHGARAACDVTGFGLAGHLAEMLEASGVDAHLRPAAIPALDGVTELLARGIESTLAPANRTAALHLIDTPDDPALALLFDPQTAGGLLAGVPANRADACRAALVDAGYAHATIIGDITARQGTAPRIELAD